MSSLRIFRTNKFAGLFTVLFISAWFLCVSHISFADEKSPHTPDVAQVSHHQSTEDDGGHDQACLDHTPAPTAINYHNDLTDASMLPYDATRICLNNLDQGGDRGLMLSIFDDDHLQKRYTFLKNNTIRI